MIKLKQLLSEVIHPYKVAYHHTTRDRVDSILKNGLMINASIGKTDVNFKNYVRGMYGIIPIFLALDKDKFKEHGDWVKTDMESFKEAFKKAAIKTEPSMDGNYSMDHLEIFIENKI